jgi:hypothetical protein
VLRGVGKVLDGAASLFESLLGGGTSGGNKGAEPDNRQPLGAGAVQPPDEREEAVRREQDARSARRQELMRDYGREVPEETARDAEIERDKRGRERER